MDEQKKPRSRVKKEVGEGKDFEKQGKGLGTGPVNNTGSYQDRREQRLVRILQQHALSRRKQDADGGFRGLDAQADIGQEGFGEDRAGNGE